jgi:Protein of unknown function (DUF2752)
MGAGTILRDRHAADPARRHAALLLGASTAAATTLALVDPAARHLPLCPANALLGVDCPACGTLRGVHAILQGDVATALDHNVLLAVAVPVAVVGLALALVPLLGRPARRVEVPRWAGVVAIAVAGVFTLLRNLPFDAFAYLASGA